MPTLHENSEEYIYDAIVNTEDGPKYTWDETNKVYKYSNSKFPNKIYTKIFDPKSLGMQRGDVIHFGNDDYRNNNKMIFDGERLENLYTEIDDYGSVPPTYECGDSPNEFNIGDFENIIDHNNINWLSKEKLKDIYIYEKDNVVSGEVMIKGKRWYIQIDMYSHEESEFRSGWWGSKKFKCNINDDNQIKININNSYIINTVNNDDEYNFKNIINDDNNVNIINYYDNTTGGSWFGFQIKNETKLSNIVNIPTFPLIWKKVTQHYTSELLLFNKEKYDYYIKSDQKELDKIYINEIIGYTITIKLIEKDINEKINYVKEFINGLIENHDNIKDRHTFSHEGTSLLQMYL
jgi:hypothetical protein